MASTKRKELRRFLKTLFSRSPGPQRTTIPVSKGLEVEEAKGVIKGR